MQRSRLPRVCPLDFPKGTGGDISTEYDTARKLHVVDTRGLWFTADLTTGRTRPMKSLRDAVVGAGKTPSFPDASMTYDPDSNRVLGLANDGVKDGHGPVELWACDAAKDDWSQVKMAGAPPRGDIRWGLLVHDPDYHCCLLVNVLGIQGSRLQAGPVDDLFAFRLSKEEADGPT